MKNPIVTLTMSDDSVIKIELYPEVAPNTVRNFISLINQKFYDGLTFHRVINGFMIQGGCPQGNGMGPNSAGSQFFIMHQDAPHLDGAYAAFGSVIEGMDVVDKIASVDTDYNDRPNTEQKIKSMTVETFGEDYAEPEKC